MYLGKDPKIQGDKKIYREKGIKRQIEKKRVKNIDIGNDPKRGREIDR